MKYKNIIFDLDGTLWDSRSTLIDSWNSILKKHNLLEKPLKEKDLNPFMGLLLPEILPTIFPKIDPKILDKILQEIMDHEADNLRLKGGILYDRVEDILKELNENHDLFIVSNCQDGYIEAFLDYFKFHDLFRDFESFGRTGKPKIDNIKSVLVRNGLKKYETVYVGDTQTDYTSATGNQLDFIFCEYGFGELNPNLIVSKINSFQEIINLTK
ncbi:HAD family hydrolase [Moheibacter lacus]|uniref:phosphoglycolate phosphatase n=1 Tax=Moheibacter lacus TaxID=2745851 RepID=A0A838ZKP7_9FLAO|nr:HAD family hydrolase [Moheibacter lacus]MBA5629828.1 HAD family hydrolase [Moheibacter lacus]